MKRAIAAAGVIAAVALTASPAMADDTPDCKDIAHQVISRKKGASA
jgi:hypothetical protein